MRDNALSITFNGISSDDFDYESNLEILNVNFNSGTMRDESLIGDRDLEVEMRRNTNVADFYSIKYDPLTFSINLCVNGEITQANKIAITKWLVTNSYKQLIFSTQPDIIYYAMVKDGVVLTHNSNNRGYFTVNFECNAPWGFTITKDSGVENISGSDTFSIDVDSVFDTHLVKVSVEMTGDSDLLIKNNTNGSEIRFEDLDNGDKIVIDCFNHSFIAEDSSESVILVGDKKVNNEWLYLSPEINEIEVTGDCDLIIYYQGIKI